MKRLIMTVVVVLSTMLVGCGHSFYPTDNHNVATTNVNIGEGNFHVVGMAEGTARATYVFGIGGLSRKAVKSNAYAEMVQNADLQGSQMIVNATIETKTRGFAPFVVKHEVKYHGLIIEFDKE